MIAIFTASGYGPAGQLECRLHLVGAERVSEVGPAIGMLGRERIGPIQDPPAIQRHTRFQSQVVAQHGSHTDRVTVVVGHPEVEHRAPGRGGLDGVAECRDLMADRLDDDVGPVVAGVRTQRSLVARTAVSTPNFRRCRRGRPDRRRSRVGRRRLSRRRRTAARRALADDADVATVQVGQLLEGIEHAGQRLQADGVCGVQPESKAPTVSVGHHAFHQPVEPRCPAHDAIAGRCDDAGWRCTSPTTSWIGKPSISAPLPPGRRALPCAPGRRVGRCHVRPRPGSASAPDRRRAPPGASGQSTPRSKVLRRYEPV